jgi:hypothetical protein
MEVKEYMVCSKKIAKGVNLIKDHLLLTTKSSLKGLPIFRIRD